MRLVFLDDLRRLCARALASGAKRVSMTRIVWDIAGNCERAYVSTTSARPGPSGFGSRWVVITPGGEVPLTLEMHTRCRECPKCLEARRRLWSARARHETRAHPRTWFGTITLRPEDHFRFLVQASQLETKHGVDFEGLSPHEKFVLVDRQIWRELSKMLKRIRKSYPGRMRHMIVTEQHQSGLPHYHALVHQMNLEYPLKYSQLEGQWPHGFTKWRLVKSLSEAGYVAKYLSKSFDARVRASKFYGSQNQSISDHSPLLVDVENLTIGRTEDASSRSLPILSYEAESEEDYG